MVGWPMPFRQRALAIKRMAQSQGAAARATAFFVSATHIFILPDAFSHNKAFQSRVRSLAIPVPATPDVLGSLGFALGRAGIAR